ncbi:MAG TPA: hypothetical protein VK589_23560 [Chryseolinea sp.]|nr:hypothetical protein [Chryseolinea sp.]
MKTLLALVVALMIVTTGKASKPEDAIIIGQTKNKSLFVYKTQRKFVGAMVEVYTSNGDLLTAQNLQKRKLIIDFGTALKDTYTIRVVKGDDIREFHYIKR